MMSESILSNGKTSHMMSVTGKLSQIFLLFNLRLIDLMKFNLEPGNLPDRRTSFVMGKSQNKSTRNFNTMTTAQNFYLEEELDDIIRYGSKELFVDESDEAGKARQIHYDDTAIDRLLDRGQVGNEEASNDDEAEDGFLKAFKVANFEYIDEVEAEAVAAAAAAAAEEEEAKKQSVATRPNAERAAYWEELLRHGYDLHHIEEASSLGKRRRNQKQVVSAEEDDLVGLKDVSSEDGKADWIDADILSSGNASGRKTQVSRKRGRADNGESVPLMEGEGKSFKVLRFNNQQRAQFVILLMRFGFGNYDWCDFVSQMKQKTPEEINAYGFLMMNHVMEEVNDDPCFSAGVPKEGLRVVDVHIRNATLPLIREKVALLAEKPGMHLFEDDIVCRYPALRGGRVWKEEHDKALLCALLRHGYGKWQSILEDKEFGFLDIIRVEQKLYSTNDVGAQIHDGTNYGYGQNGVAQGSMYQESSVMYSFSRDAQRKLVEYIKKRVYLLEKGLNAEYAKIYFAELEANDRVHEEPDVEPKVPDIASPASSEIELEINEPSSPLDDIAVDEDSSVTNSICGEIAKLYNKMSNLIADNIKDSVRAHAGNELAACRLGKNIFALDGINEDVKRILSVQQETSVSVEELNLNQPAQCAGGLVFAEVPTLLNSDSGPKTEPVTRSPTNSLFSNSGRKGANGGKCHCFG
ncbi:CHD3-type chromatin-remodeling factor PICKLE-like [Aristolochia californica]|uniref:CHD3-type chromatin-remodeling factor PICKLE-like n=1 Tax=Aristolochia californica TaxID=171875 RepID=UPI0035E0EA1E